MCGSGPAIGTHRNIRPMRPKRAAFRKIRPEADSYDPRRAEYQDSPQSSKGRLASGAPNYIAAVIAPPHGTRSPSIRRPAMSDFDASFVKGTRHEADGNSPLFGSSHRTGPPVCACPGPHKLRIDEWDPADTG